MSSPKLHRVLALGAFALIGIPAFAADVHRAIVSRVSPVYPELAKRMHVGGKVMLLVTIQPDGTVSATKVESGHALLVPAAEDAVRRWHFAPNSESSETVVEIAFNIAD